MGRTRPGQNVKEYEVPIKTKDPDPTTTQSADDQGYMRSSYTIGSGAIEDFVGYETEPEINDDDNPTPRKKKNKIVTLEKNAEQPVKDPPKGKKMQVRKRSKKIGFSKTWLQNSPVTSDSEKD